jgi:hypothetical protein
MYGRPNSIIANPKKKPISPSIAADDHEELERKISLATEGFTMKFCEALLKDRNRLKGKFSNYSRIYHIDEKRLILALAMTLSRD